MNPYHQANRTRWNAAASKWKAMIDRRGNWREIPTRPDLVFAEQEMKYFTALAGKKVAVLGSGDILEPDAGGFSSYEFHWTVSDLIQAMLRAGCRLVEAAEFGMHVGDWEGAPLEGLPECILLAGIKE